MAEDLAEVLRLLHDSDRRWQTLRAEGLQWSDPERSREAFFRSVRPGGVVSARGTPGPADMDPTWKVWMAPPRFRAEVGGPHQSRMLIIGDGQRVCSSHPSVAHLRVTDQRAGEQPHIGPGGELLRPAGLPSVLRLEMAGRQTFLGREVIVVRGRPRPEAEHRGPSMFMADEVEAGVDAERGVLLWKEQRLRQAPFRRVEMTNVAFDEDLDPALFEFPDAPQVLGSSLPVPGQPRRPPAPHHRPGPPDSVLGQPVAGHTIVARAEVFVIAVDRIVAYPTGFEMAVTVRTRGEPVFGSFDELHRRSWNGSAAFPGESLRVGVVFADGRRSFVENFPPRPASSGDVRLMPMRGGGTQLRFDQWYWVEPLPPPGALGVVVEWEREGLPETRADLDAGAIVAAASRAETLWP